MFYPIIPITSREKVFFFLPCNIMLLFYLYLSVHTTKSKKLVTVEVSCEIYLLLLSLAYFNIYKSLVYSKSFLKMTDFWNILWSKTENFVGDKIT